MDEFTARALSKRADEYRRKYPEGLRLFGVPLEELSESERLDALWFAMGEALHWQDRAMAISDASITKG